MLRKVRRGLARLATFLPDASALWPSLEPLGQISQFILIANLGRWSNFPPDISQVESLQLIDRARNVMGNDQSNEDSQKEAPEAQSAVNQKAE